MIKRRNISIDTNFELAELIKIYLDSTKASKTKVVKQKQRTDTCIASAPP